MKKPAAPSATVDGVTLKPQRKGGLPAIPAIAGCTTNVLESAGIPRISCATPATYSSIRIATIIPVIIYIQHCFFISLAVFLIIVFQKKNQNTYFSSLCHYDSI